MTKKILTRYPVLKTAWRELLYRPQWYGDTFDEFERLFRWSADPWNFETSRYEQERLQCLLGIVQQYPHDTVLEVGCAEGLFTSQLTKIAKDVVAIDVSPTALSRAKQRCPGTTFLHKSLQEFSSDCKFDLVVCSETLYYINDVEGAIDKLTSLGRHCLVSYIHREARTLDSFFLRMPLVQYTRFEKAYWLWKRAMNVAVWENNGSTFYFKHDEHGLPK